MKNSRNNQFATSLFKTDQSSVYLSQNPTFKSKGKNKIFITSSIENSKIKPQLVQTEYRNQEANLTNRSSSFADLEQQKSSLNLNSERAFTLFKKTHKKNNKYVMQDLIKATEPIISSNIMTTESSNELSNQHFNNHIYGKMIHSTKSVLSLKPIREQHYDSQPQIRIEQIDRKQNRFANKMS